MPLMHRTRIQLIVGIAIGLVVCVMLGAFIPVDLAIMAGVTTAEFVFIGQSLRVLIPMDPEQTARNVGSEDLSPIEDEILVAVVSIAAIISLVILNLNQHHGDAAEIIAAALMLLGVFGAWGCVQQTYAIHYAYLYYLEDDGGIDFHEQAPATKPRFTDFMYLSYSIGMTYGVTDPEVTSARIRFTVLRHSVLAFIFGMAILGAAINLVAGIFQ